MDGGQKRPHAPDFAERNGRQKRRNQGGGYNGSRDLPMAAGGGGVPIPEDAVYRILCPAQKIGSVIGKGGSIIKTLRQESGAKIKIADDIPGVEERVIIISGPERASGEKGNRGTGGKPGRDGHRGGEGRDRERDKEGKEESENKDKNSINNNTSNNSNNNNNNNNKEREGAATEREGGGEKLSPAQEALFKVHARIIADVETSSRAAGGDGGPDQEEEPAQQQQVITRLLVPNNQIGCLLGKGGKIIEQMRQSSGAQIRVLPKDQLPGCALPTDEIVQISGDGSVLKKALLAISSRLQENPPRDRPQAFAPPGPAFVPVGNYLPKDAFHNGGGGPLFGLGPGRPLDGGGGWPFGGRSLPLHRPDNNNNNNNNNNKRRRNNNKDGRDTAENELVFRLLCPSDKIGSVIGKGGSIIHNLRKETGARIKIADAVPGSDERVIIVSAVELPGDTFSPALEAMIQVQGRTTAEMGGDNDGIVTTRLLVPTNQIGCLLGKGGSIIADMRKASRANIRILPKDTLPRCALESDELVQIVGDTNVAREALFQVISRLRNNAFREGGSDTGRVGGGIRDFASSLPPITLPGNDYSNSYDYGTRMEPGSPGGGMFTLSGMSMPGAIHSSSGFGSLASNPETWSITGGGGLSGLSGFGGGSSHLMQPLAGGFGGPTGNLGATSTVEVHIPNTSVGSVIGKGGSNIAHIRQISGAKVKLHNSEQGTTERVLELSGTVEQTHAAKSLVHSYMQSGGGLLRPSAFAV